MTQYGAEEPEKLLSSLRTAKSNGQPRVIASGDQAQWEDDWTKPSETAETSASRAVKTCTTSLQGMQDLREDGPQL